MPLPFFITSDFVIKFVFKPKMSDFITFLFLVITFKGSPLQCPSLSDMQVSNTTLSGTSTAAETE
jgi:hypothetical protein